MIVETFQSLGPWSWMILAAALLILEMLAPGVFLMWFGMAAAATGLIAFRYDITWQLQLIWFCGLSLVTVLVVHRYLRKHPLQSEQPLLNERGEQLVGRSFDLADAIQNGRGSVRIGDSVWSVEGPELAAGTRIKVVGVDGTVLKVEPETA